MMKLDIGCGGTKYKGPDNNDDTWVGMDRIRFPGVDICIDIGNERWPIHNNSVTEARSCHFIEHLTAIERVHFCNELHRVLVPDGKCTVIAPHWSSSRAYGDPTHCFAEDTEILTASGWKPIRSVVVGELVPALDLETERTQLVPVAQVIDHPYVGNMLHFKTINMDLMVTPNHDMVWRAKGGNNGYWKRKGVEPPRPKLRKSTADSFIGMVGHHPRCGMATMDWSGESPSRIRIAEDEMSLGRLLPAEFDAGDFAELIGWFVSEGHVDLSSHGHYRVVIGQSSEVNPAKVQQISDLVKRLGFSPSVKWDRVVFSSKPLALYLHKLGLSHQKYVPEIIKGLSKDLLLRFLDAALKGDGRRNGNGWEYATISARLADDVQEIAVKAGYRTSLRLEKRVGMSSMVGGCEITAKNDMYMVGISPPADIWYPAPESVQYAGRIVCVTLGALHNIFVRRNGKPIWSGNCWPPVGEFWFIYLDRTWRNTFAPHTDAAHWPQGYACDFQVAVAHLLNPVINARDEVFKEHATKHYREAVFDISATLIKRAMPVVEGMPPSAVNAGARAEMAALAKWRST